MLVRSAYQQAIKVFFRNCQTSSSIVGHNNSGTLKCEPQSNYAKILKALKEANETTRQTKTTNTNRKDSKASSGKIRVKAEAGLLQLCQQRWSVTQT